MDILKMIKEAGRIRSKLKEAGEVLSAKRESVSHKGIFLEVNGKGDFIGLKMERSSDTDPAALSGDLLEAVNMAVQRARSMQKEVLKELAGGMDIPGLPF